MQSLQVSKLFLKWNNDHNLKKIDKSCNFMSWNINILFKYNEVRILMICGKYDKEYSLSKEYANDYNKMLNIISKYCYYFPIRMALKVFSYHEKFNKFIDLNKINFNIDQKTLSKINVYLLIKIIKKMDLDYKNNYDLCFTTELKETKIMWYYEWNFRKHPYYTGDGVRHELTDPEDELSSSLKFMGFYLQNIGWKLILDDIDYPYTEMIGECCEGFGYFQLKVYYYFMKRYYFDKSVFKFFKIQAKRIKEYSEYYFAKHVNILNKLNEIYN